MPKSLPASDGSARGRLSLHPPDLFPVLLSRLFDHEVSTLAPWVQPIEPDRFAEFSRSVAQQKLTLPRMFVAAERVFGRSSARFDHHKSSFRFPVLMSAMRDGMQLRYVLVLQDVRASVRVEVYRFSESREPPGRYYPAVDAELSRREIDLVANALTEFLHTAGGVAARTASSFHRTVPSEFVVYGCRDGDLFEGCFESAAEYQQAVARISLELGDVERCEELQQVMELFGDAIAEIRPRV